MLGPEYHPHSPGRLVPKSEVITDPEGADGPRRQVALPDICFWLDSLVLFRR
jgi:hypothetical protein